MEFLNLYFMVLRLELKAIAGSDDVEIALAVAIYKAIIEVEAVVFVQIVFRAGCVTYLFCFHTSG